MRRLAPPQPLQLRSPIANARTGEPTPQFMQLFNSLVDNTALLDDGKQAGDASLSALANVNDTGLLTRTGNDTYAARTLEGGPGVTITNPAGIAGNPLIEVATGSYIPLVDGSEPPGFITDGAGQLILVSWSP